MTDPTRPPYEPQQFSVPPHQQPVGPQPMYGQPLHPVEPLRKSHTLEWVLGITGGVLVLVLLGCIGVVAIGAKGVRQDQTSARSDVRLTVCGFQQLVGSTTGTADLSITNSSSTAKDYVVTVAFDSKNDGKRYGAAQVAIYRLGPGQTTTTTAIGIQAVGGDMTCKILSVSRVKPAGS
jgi:hypothetical protein